MSLLIAKKRRDCLNNSLDKVVCLTPTKGKAATRIDKWKYDLVSEALIALIPETGDGVLFSELSAGVAQRIGHENITKLGSCRWYTTTVKLDLEVKQRIVQVKGSKPQRLLTLP
ncbi:hypothetical protein Sden_2836 [Shewanella denitrificans OS217]|uniref:Uncharacterized protein n=1 Tax=Shewanella denitrificans (strain OS217 / ATCC BAA-1090 / DSM 15013) TaxID=318161 RepID=Q12KB1_SHEDO|nr:hypothetical protein [Shewanella denitrificans]ABE56115.1 hypothetical protein Sden_2836 [Shewanella denitrificans OS217]